MAQDEKLTKLLQGRTIQSTQNKNGQMIVGFDNGATLTVPTGSGSSNSAATGGTVRAVQRETTSLHLEMTNGETLTIPLPDGGEPVVQSHEAAG